MSRPSRLEMFAAFTAQFPLLTRQDLEGIVEDMRQSSGFDRMLEHAREQAEAIGLEVADLVEIEPQLASADGEEEKSGPIRTSGFHRIGRLAI